MHLTPDIAAALAPDDGTLQRAKKLANPRSWILAERNERALWGECSGSGSEPYKAVVDMNGPAYKCSCPVKKFPCKHTLALLLMAAEDKPNTFGQNPPPPYVSEWVDSRDRRNAVKAEPRTDEQIARSEAGKEKNRAERLEMMEEGIKDLQRRLLDMVREGLAALSVAQADFFQDFAARMVDAKLGGLSRRIKSWVAYTEKYPDDWHERLLSELGILYLFTKAFQNFDKIPDTLKDDLFIQAGVSIKKEELLTEKGIVDDWLVLGQIETKEEDNLTSRRVWLMGKNTQKVILVLDFAFGNTGYMTAWITGITYKAEVVYYPSSYPLRVAVKTVESAPNMTQLIGFDNFTHFFNDYSKVISLQPWIAEFPVLFSQVIPVFQKNTFYLLDNEQYFIDTEGVQKSERDDMGWQLMALSGGKPISVFGEWDGEVLRPLSVFAEGRLVII